MLAQRRHAPAARLELAELGVRLTRTDGGIRAALALVEAYEGETSVVIGFGGIRHARACALSKLLRAAAWLVEPWGTEGRIDLRSLRPAVRRAVLAWLDEREQLAVLAAARHGIVVAPAPDAALLREAARLGVAGNRRRMLLLGARDGEHCVWCGRHLTHRSPDATVDHVRCRSRGGGNGLENLVLACAPCNNLRSDVEAEEWLARRVSAGDPVDVATVRAAIRRSDRHHRRERSVAAVAA